VDLWFPDTLLTSILMYITIWVLVKVHCFQWSTFAYQVTDIRYIPATCCLLFLSSFLMHDNIITAPPELQYGMATFSKAVSNCILLKQVSLASCFFGKAFMSNCRYGMATFTITKCNDILLKQVSLTSHFLGKHFCQIVDKASVLK
jgi:hypothetical protein